MFSIRTNQLRTISSILLGFGLIFSASRAHSAPQKPPGITVSPVTQTISIPASVSSEQVSFKVTNNTPDTITLQLKIIDFNTLDESGGVLFAGTNESQLTKKYGLAKWAKLDQSSVTLAPQQSQVVAATLLNPPNLPPGGHYGAVVFQLNGVVGPSGVSAQVNLNQALSSLLFVAKVGGERFSLTLEKPKTQTYWAKLPQSLTLRFYNGGNMHVVPRGTVLVTDPFGKVAARGYINEGSQIVLPETHRRFPITLTQRINALIPGIYTVHVNYRYDGKDDFTPLTYSIIVWNVYAVIGLIVLLALLAWATWRRHRLWAWLRRKGSAAAKRFPRAQ